MNYQSNRVRQAIAATLQGLPLMETIEEFEPPKIDFDMETQTGGRFLPEEMAKALKALQSKLQLQGVGLPIMLALGVSIGDDILLQVREGGKDIEGNTYSTWHTIGGRLQLLEEDKLKMGSKPVTNLGLAVRTYMRQENGVIVIDIDARTQKIVINGKDIMADVRRAVLMG